MQGADRLFERGSELDLIEENLRRAVAGTGSSLIVEGPAGIGKTSLLDATADLARELGMKVLRSRGGILEQDLEFGVVRQLFEREVLMGDAAHQEDLLSGPARVVGQLLGLDQAADPGPGQDVSERMYHGIYWLLVNLTRNGPVVLILDDAHWADLASLEAGTYATRRLDDLPVAMLVGVRNDEPRARAMELTAALTAEEQVHIPLGPLGESSVEGILARAFEADVPPSLVTGCLEASGGNPFFATELARELAKSHGDPGSVDGSLVHEFGPVAVRRTVLLRLGSLGDDARSLAWALAVLGGEGELRHAAAVADLEPEAAAEAADRLVAGGIVDPGQPLKISHPLIGAVIVDDIPDSREAAAHRRAFEVLSGEAASDDLLASHALGAEPSGNQELVSVLARTSRRAMASGSPAVAVKQLRRALRETPLPDVRERLMLELARAEIRAGDFADGLSHLDMAVGEGPSLPEGLRRERLFAVFASEGIEQAKELVKGEIERAEKSDDPQSLQLTADLATFALLSGVDHGQDLSRFEDSMGETRAERTILAILAHQGQTGTMHSDQVIELARRALGDGRLIDEDTSESLAWYLAVYVLITCEDHDVARSSINHAIRDSDNRGSTFGKAGALGARAVLALNEGRPVDAEGDVLTVFRGVTPPILKQTTSATAIRALVDQGRLEEAERVLRDGGIDSGPGGPTVLRWIPWARACLHEAQGDQEAVASDLAPLIDDEKNHRSMKALSWRAMLARMMSRSGHSAEAEALACDQLEWARWWGRPAALGTAMRAHALAGQPEERVERLSEAVEVLGSSRLAIEETKARLELGVSLLRSGKKTDGREVLKSALDLAVERGARGLAAVANQELEISGTAPKRLMFDELTASERRIAEFAAEGRTNRQIAEELFVTPKTVENHLTRVYAKLGVNSRRDLAGAL